MSTPAQPRTTRRRTVAKPPAAPSVHEALLLLHLSTLASLPAPDREVRFLKQRRWRFDFAWPDWRIAVECEGATWAGGRHTRGAGYASDCAKYNEAAIHGWLVIRATGQQIENGQALAWIEQAFATRTGAQSA